MSERKSTEVRFTHGLQYQRPDGTWHAGFLAFTLREAKGVAKEGRKRTGHGVRVVKLAESR